MQLIAHGIDLVECERIAVLLARHGERFRRRVLTPIEREQAARFANPVPHISGRFAAKEAILKVLGTGWRGKISWTDMEITNDRAGAPLVRLSGEAARVAAQRGIGQILLSITHTENYAAASALGLSEAPLANV
ncbi:MAG TPA: holo-ACP synthase [Phycisphaerae bacterium]|jgi:holo-[acyl-carrier protein] synthase